MSGRAASVPATHNPNHDIECASPPDDSVSCMKFSPRANILAASSWDNKIRIWDVRVQPTAPTILTQPKSMFSLDRPPLSIAWSGDGQRVLSAGCDNMAKMWDVNTGQATQVGAHDAPIKEVAFIESLNLVVTGSWDKTLRYWDGRSPTPVGRVQLPERVYCMDARGTALVVGLAERNIQVFDVRSPSAAYKTVQSQLKFQTRCVALFPNCNGFLLGSIEGRCAVQHLNAADEKNNFSFKCHRADPPGDEVWAVNGVGFNHLNTFYTVGSDGGFNFWDMFAKKRLKAFSRSNFPITAACFNYDPSSTIFAYAVGYDWSKGAEFHQPAYKSHIMLHPTPASEITPEAAKR